MRTRTLLPWKPSTSEPSVRDITATINSAYERLTSVRKETRGYWRIRSIILAALISICFIPGAQAWSNGGYSADPANPDYGTHDWIADRALDIQIRNVTFLSTTYHSRFLLGTEAPDNPAYIGDSSNHHVYYYSDGTLQDGKEAVRASEMYDLAVAYLNANDYSNASFYLGAMAHYIADLGVFGHTMGSGTAWGAEAHHSDYEDKVEAMTGFMPSPSGLSLGDKYASNAALDIAKDITFGSGAIEPNIWMDANYNWGNAVFSASVNASLNAAIEAVAATINHLMIEVEPNAPLASTGPLPTVPLPPASLRASIDGALVLLAWTSPSSDGGASIIDFDIYRGTDPNHAVYLTSVPNNIFSWHDEPAGSGGTYYYWVVARNSVGQSIMSQAKSVTMPNDTGTMILTIALSAISVVTVSGGALMWRKKRQNRD